MLETLFIRFLEISVTTGIIILGLRLLAPCLNKTYAAKWKYWIWLILAVRLIVPVNIPFPAAPIEVSIPNGPVNTPDNVTPYVPAPDIVTPQPDAAAVRAEQMQPLAKAAQRAITLLDAFIAAWALGVAAFLMYQLVGYFIFKRKVLRWSRLPQDPRIESTVRWASSQIGLSRRVVPLISDTASSPLMLGFFRPLLILPGETYSDADLSFIVRHELTHCKRNDLWYKLLLIIAMAVHWYNPAVYLMLREASGDLELSCDDAVTNGMDFGERKAYTETILASIQWQRMKKSALSTYFHGGSRTMKNRFINILNTEKKRRGVFALLAVVLCTTLAGGLFACTPSGKHVNENSSKSRDTIPATNIADTNIEYYEGMEGVEDCITYGDSTKEVLDKDYIGLFINGSIIKNANLIRQSDTIFLPVSVITENLGIKLEWNAETGKAAIFDGENTIEFFIDNKNTRVNGKELTLSAAPRLHNKQVYVPVSFAAETLHATVGYFDGEDTTKPHIVKRMPHVMISRYPDSVKMLSKEEAVQKAREQLIIAYEKRYGKFVPLAENEKPSREDDKAILRDVMTNLTVKSENDRYYVMPVMYDFWVDKYTGDVYTYYNGLAMQIMLFDPYHEGALAFPG